MEECETLSSRLAIITKGGVIECSGTALAIKNDYGKFFNVELTFKKVYTDEDLDDSNVSYSIKKRGSEPL